MAGIGMKLRSMNRRESLIFPAVSLGHGALIAAGPWIFTVLAIALIHRGTAQILAPSDSYDFRGQMIYAFSLSLLATAPIVNVAVRQVADDLFRNDLGEVRSRYVATLILCAAASAALCAVVLVGIFSVAGADLAVALFATTTVGMIWPTLAFCTAIRDYSGITFGFVIGLAASVVATIFVAHADWGPVAMTATFTWGLALVFFGLAGRVLSNFDRSTATISSQIAGLIEGCARYRWLALGAATAMAALWIDKWIMWFGPYGVPLNNGLVSAPVYDGAMFVAYLAIIPALGLFITAIEGGFLEAYRAYYDAIRNRGTLSRVQDARARLTRYSFRLLGRTLLTLALICATIALAAPALVNAAGLQFQQIGILRLGVVAALFQFQFLACTSLLLFFERHGRFFALQAVFLVCQVAFTLLSLWLGPDYYGFGHLVACALAGYLSFEVLERTLRDLDFLTFDDALRLSIAESRAGTKRPQPVPQAQPSPIVLKPASGGPRRRPLLAP